MRHLELNGLRKWLVWGAIGAALLPSFAAAVEKGEKKEKEVEIPAPEIVTLPTRDGLELKATFYPGVLGKKTVPIVMLHDFKGNRNEFHGLALLLQSQGNAVIVPDLRGHGDSTRFKDPASQRVGEIEASRMRPADFNNIVLHDLQAVRKFLLSKNNDGELNLNKLVVIGSGMGATLALNWSLIDWSFPPLATGKQGQDVKALVLISPEWSFKGLPIDRALAHPEVRSQISMLIFVGAQNSRALKEATRIHNRLTPYHPEPPADKVRTDKDLFLQELSTALQGTKLITVRELGMPATIAQFIQLRVTDRDFPWTDRVSPIQ